MGHSVSQNTKTTKTTDNFADNAPTGKTLCMNYEHSTALFRFTFCTWSFLYTLSYSRTSQYSTSTAGKEKSLNELAHCVTFTPPQNFV